MKQQHRSRHVSCSCTDEERLIVHAKAKEAKLSVSQYLRKRLPEDVWERPKSAGPPGRKSG